MIDKELYKLRPVFNQLEPKCVEHHKRNQGHKKKSFFALWPLNFYFTYEIN